ncbi:hypothetical protein P7C70_g866, partial [Phenoliferia sp. Uapishka_3]
MVSVQVVSVVTGVVFIFGTLFTMPDATLLISAQLSQCAYIIFESVMGTPGGAFALILVSSGAGFFLIVGSLNAAARFLWAVSRDGVLPGSKWLAVIHPRLKIPLNSMILICVICGLLSLISFGSTVAFSAFLGSCTITLLIAYLMPIFFNVLSGRQHTRDAPWSLGRWGWPVNVAALLLGLFGCILFLLPLTTPVTVAAMSELPTILRCDSDAQINFAPDWSVVMVCGFAFIGVLYYVVQGRKVFRAPGLTVAAVKEGDLEDVKEQKEQATAEVNPVNESEV